MSHASTVSSIFVASLIAAATSLVVACGPAATTDPQPTPTQQGGGEPLPPMGNETRPTNDTQMTGAMPDVTPADSTKKPHPTGKIWQVTIDGDQFTPATLTMGLGDTVQFTWTDGYHSVSSGFDCLADGMFESGSHGGPWAYRVTFLRPGIFPYFSQPQCDVMKGMIVVKGE